MSESEHVLIEVKLPAPIDTVWRALRDPAELRRWFGWQYGGDHGGLDDEIRQIFHDAAEVSEAHKTLRWEHGDQFTLEQDGRRTLLRVTRAAPADGASWDDVYDDISQGWITFVQQLRFALDRHPGEERRTVYLDGHAADVDAFPVEAALGMTDVAALAPESPFDTRIATHEPLSGEVWFHRAHQFGVTVAQYGDGLLIIGNRPPDPLAPHGSGWALITTYGLDDATFADLEQRWTSWWHANYKAAADSGL